VPVDDAAAYYGSLYSEESRTRPERDEFIDALVKGTAEKVEEIDSLITSHADNWRLSACRRSIATSYAWQFTK
jgi:transcription termination factor NusB